MGTGRYRTRLIRALCCAAAVVAVTGGGSALAASMAVSISGFSFSPAAVSVVVGDTVTWTNSDAVVHTATADDGSWNAGNIAASGGIGAVVFSTAGTFPYHCSIHTAMTGTITVAAAGASAAPTSRATMSPTDTAPIGGSDRGPGGSWLAALMTAAAAAAVGATVYKRQAVPMVVAATPRAAAPAHSMPRVRAVPMTVAVPMMQAVVMLRAAPMMRAMPIMQVAPTVRVRPTVQLAPAIRAMSGVASTLVDEPPAPTPSRDDAPPADDQAQGVGSLVPVVLVAAASAVALAVAVAWRRITSDR